MKKQLCLFAAVLTVALCAAAPAGAQTAASADAWPSKPVKLIVPFSAASSADNLARALAERLSARFKQPFIVDNRTGAGGTIGVAAAAKSPPDGYTLLLTTSSPLVISPLIDKTVAYDVQKELVPVAEITSGGLLLVSGSEVPAKNLKELIELIRKNPGKFSFASNGNGSYSHMAMELFKQKTGTFLVHIPYKGPAQAETDVMGGQVTLMFDSVATGTEMIKAGRLRAYGISSLAPDPLAPQYPPLAAQGVPELKDFDVIGWAGLLAPRGTPPAVVSALTTAVRELTGDAAFRTLMTRRNSTLVAPEAVGDMARHLQVDRKRWEAVVKSANIKLE